ncbi:MAG: LPS assembly protein LptD [Candidatus Competibacteraceae bacterium]|nr:LPS assembly protein LptD [Candidatus Competibacteraceae bacterium]
MISFLLVLYSVNVLAQSAADRSAWRLCEADDLARFIRADTGATQDGPIRFLADEGQATLAEALLEGDVRVNQGDRYLQANEVSMDRQTNRVRASGEVVYGDPQIAVRSRSAELNLTDEVGIFNQADYYVPERNAQGSAERVQVEKRSEQSLLEQVTYSTCVRGAEFWQLRTGELALNEQTGRGTARDITLAIKGVPVMYFPYLSFPINDQRQSGFLIPSGGYDSNSGVDLRVPYYWNIAPNQDMTLAPRVLSKRGAQLGVEYRFLRAKDRGEIEVEYLPDDKKFGDDRAAVFANYFANPLNSFYADVLYQEVSDDEYLDDFDNTIDLLSVSTLERHLNLTYYGRDWLALARVQDFQIVDDSVFDDPEDEPYSRLPQVLFDGNWRRRTGGLDYRLRAEWVNFDHDNAVTGKRLDIESGVSLPLNANAGFLIPSLDYRYTAYNLDNTAPGTDNSPTRSAPIASVDAGLVFERPLQLLNWLGGNGIQTLEPRLFYLYIPFRDQAEIPIFDSTDVDVSYPWLFLDNRFTGADRLGDANQLTAALTTRYLNPANGRERWRASIGQIYYFQDRRVTLDNTAPEDSSSSDLIAEAIVNYGSTLSLRGALQWDIEVDQINRGAIDILYHPGASRLLNLSHRFVADELEQIDLALVWPIQTQWRTVARWNYSLKENRNLDLLAGLEYEECCWALRLLARQRRDDPDDDDPTSSVLVELELKGLAGIGSNINNVLERAIFGYDADRY